MDPDLDRDLTLLERARWEDNLHVMNIGVAIREWATQAIARLDRLDRMEAVLNKMEADPDKHAESLPLFEEFKSA